MAAISPFLANAGMREIEMPICRADARIADALAHERIEPWQLASGVTTPLIDRELKRWQLRRGAAVRSVAPEQLAVEAARRLLARPRAYVCGG
ncbi:MAG: hypothetical protein AAGB51_10395 [Planctomycetota bacterium]